MIRDDKIGLPPPRTGPVNVAVVQAAPVLFDTPRTLQKLTDLAANAARQGAELVVFPEAFVGGNLTRTGDELSVVCRQEVVPTGTQAEVGWCCLRVAGAMPFTLVGVLASLTGPVAAAGVGVFAFSTFDTDYLLVQEADFPAAVAALRGAGHSVEQHERGR